MKEETKNELVAAALKELELVEKSYGEKFTQKYAAFDAAVSEKIRLVTQRIEYLEEVSTPEHLEEKMNELTEVVTTLQQAVDTVLKRVKAVIDDKLIECVTYEEMLAAYKMSGCTLQDLSDMIPCDVSAASRIINGLRNRGDIPLYHKIKQFCLERVRRDSEKFKKKG